MSDYAIARSNLTMRAGVLCRIFASNPPRIMAESLMHRVVAWHADNAEIATDGRLRDIAVCPFESDLGSRLTLLQEEHGPSNPFVRDVCQHLVEMDLFDAILSAWGEAWLLSQIHDLTWADPYVAADIIRERAGY